MCYTAHGIFVVLNARRYQKLLKGITRFFFSSVELWEFNYIYFDSFYYYIVCILFGLASIYYYDDMICWIVLFVSCLFFFSFTKSHSIDRYRSRACCCCFLLARKKKIKTDQSIRRFWHTNWTHITWQVAIWLNFLAVLSIRFRFYYNFWCCCGCHE